MKLVSCRVCKTQVAADAKTCPHCGTAHPKRKRYGCGTLLLVVIGLPVLAAMFLGEPRGPATPKPPPAPPKPGAQWIYGSFADGMTDKFSHQASVRSINQFEFSFPYRKPQRATLSLRNHPRYGRDAILEIERGQFDCGMDGCSLQVRFDDGPARSFRFNRPDSNDTTSLFVRDYPTFYAGLSKAGLVLIEGKFYQESPVVFMFDVSDLDAEKLR